MWLFVLWFKANRWCNKMEKNHPSWGRKGGDKHSSPWLWCPWAWYSGQDSCVLLVSKGDQKSDKLWWTSFSFLCALETRKREKWRLFLRRAFQIKKVLLECRNLISHLKCRESPVGAIFTGQHKDAEKVSEPMCKGTFFLNDWDEG